ncbi:MAG: hypothetical protein RL559_498 [Pseudomonadota bacterium]
MSLPERAAAQGLSALAHLLAPWPAVLLGMVLLALAQQWTGQAAAPVLAQHLAADALMLVRALPLWCALTLPLLWLSVRARRWALGALGSLLLLVLAGLELYFSVSGVPLGADVLAYSWAEIRTTVAGANVRPPMPWWLALVLGWLAVWTSVAWLVRRDRTLCSAPAAVVLLGLCVVLSLALPTRLEGASPQADNKLVFWVGDVLAGSTQAPVVASGPYPFERDERTPDTLGPLLNLDAKTPPHLLFIVVEGLGRSFSGPGARLGSFTPFLDELANTSLYWTNFVATQGRTFAVLPSVLGSLPFGPYGERTIAHDNLLSLLQGQGYSLRYFSGSNLAFDHQGDFLAASGVQRFWSERDFTPPARKVSEWGYADGDLMTAVAHSAAPTTPSVTVVQTMSMHTPFAVPQPERWQQAVDARLDALGLRGAAREAVLRHKDIYASILYTDDALRGLFARLSQQPQWRNTVVLITGDHRLPEIEMASRIERYHVPLIVASPMLRQPLRIQSLSSHFDIAPSLLAMLSHRYAMPMPTRVHWMGTGLDVHTGWRNVHSLPLKQTKTELSDYISGEYYLAQDRLFNLQDGLLTSPEDHAEIAQALRAEFAAVRAGLTSLAQGGPLVDEARRGQRAVYADAGRTLAPLRPARQIEGVVVSGAHGQFVQGGRLTAQGVFSMQGPQDSPVFVPLLVLSDAQGQQLAEFSGQALRLKAGESQTLSLGMPVADVPSGTYFLSLIVSHPQTGRSIGKGQYHVPVLR